VFDKIRKQVLEPKIFAVIARANNAAVLHQGVHFTLEEAFNAAGKRLVESGAAKLGQPIEMDLWSAIPAREVLTKLCEVDNVPIDTVQRPEPVQISADTSIAVDETVDPGNPMGPVLKVLEGIPDVTVQVLTMKDMHMKDLISKGRFEDVAEASDLSEEEKQYVREQINKNKLNP